VLNHLRGVMTKVMTPLAELLLSRGVTPDAVTITGTAGVVVAASGPSARCSARASR